LLGDRIRMNAIEHPAIYMRSLATRETGSEVSAALPEVIAACKLAGFDLVIVETSGIGQGNAAIVPLVDVSLYVMTPEFGAASQLEKIDMLDFADFVAINKFDRKGAEDALRDVRKQYQRNHEAFNQSPDEMPVFGTMAARFNDDGVTALYQAAAAELARRRSEDEERPAAAGWLSGSRRTSGRSFRRSAYAIWRKLPRSVRSLPCSTPPNRRRSLTSARR
jgi:methylmalonyl-CoA mutase